MGGSHHHDSDTLLLLNNEPDSHRKGPLDWIYKEGLYICDLFRHHWHTRCVTEMCIRCVVTLDNNLVHCEPSGAFIDINHNPDWCDILSIGVYVYMVMFWPLQRSNLKLNFKGMHGTCMVLCGSPLRLIDVMGVSIRFYLFVYMYYCIITVITVFYNC